MVGIVCGPPSRTKDALLSKAEGRCAWMCDAYRYHTHPQPHSQAVPKGLRLINQTTKSAACWCQLVQTMQCTLSSAPRSGLTVFQFKTTPPPSRPPCILKGWTRSSCLRERARETAKACATPQCVVLWCLGVPGLVTCTLVLIFFSIVVFFLQFSRSVFLYLYRNFRSFRPFLCFR